MYSPMCVCITAGTANNVGGRLTVGSTGTDDDRQSHDSEQSSTTSKDPRTAPATAKLPSPKRALEGTSQAAEDVGRTDTTAGSGRSGTPNNVDGPSGVENQPCPPATRPPGVAPGRGKPDLGDSGPQPPPPRQTLGSGGPRPTVVSGGSGGSAAVDQIVVGVDGRRYRRLAAPGEPTTRPVRKPAKPPAVDLAPWDPHVRSPAVPSTVVPAPAAAAVDENDDDEIYDDANTVSPSELRRVTVRGGTAGRRSAAAATSVVSQISEYTEEEEDLDRRAWQQSRGGGMGPTGGDRAAAAVGPLSPSTDEVYDDVETTADIGDFDEIYEELD